MSNQISDISALANLTSLVELQLGENQITDISPLANLNHLTELELSGNQISDISALANLTNLTVLRLFGTPDYLGGTAERQISDISPLANLKNLKVLVLNINQISDISPLLENSGLGEGDLVWLGDNNLDLSNGSEDLEVIRQLEERGVRVFR